MVNIFRYFILLLFMSCSHYITEKQVANDAPSTSAPFDTLAAYRKMPGAQKDITVHGYYKKDSVYVRSYKRSKPGSN